MSTLPALKRSTDRKTANAVRPNGTHALIANTFGLPAGRAHSCAGETNYCASICYANRTETAYPNVRRVLAHNWELISTASRAEMVRMLDAMVAVFAAECDQHGAPKLFRIHWDGDFFSPVYVAAWATVIVKHPDVRFWAYTRVATAARFLHAGIRRGDLANLALYFSADRDNVELARHLAARGVPIAYVGNTFDGGKAMLAGHGIGAAVRCPENNHALPMIAPQGSACERCRLCIRGDRNVLFSATKR